MSEILLNPIKKEMYPIFQFDDTSVSAEFNLRINLEKDLSS